MDFYEKFVRLCNSVGKSPSAVALEIGIEKSTVTRWSRGSKPNKATQIKIADYFGISVSELMPGLPVLKNSSSPFFGDELNILSMPKMNAVPLVGSIACGTPILAEENIESTVDLPEHIKADFALRCKGDSMINARIYDGDIVYIRQQPTVEDGQIAAVLIDDEATLKRVHLYPDHIVLEPENPLYRPIVKWEEEMNSVKVLGLAVAFTSIVR